MVLNQSSSFSKQVSSATGCLGSARTEQRAGRSWEHSGSMIRLEIPAKKRSGPGPAHPNHRQPRCPLGPQNFHSRPGAAGPQSSEGAARVVLGGVPEQAGALSSGRPGWKGIWCKPRGLSRVLSLPTLDSGGRGAAGCSPKLPVGQSGVRASWR